MKGALVIPAPIERGLNPGSVVIRSLADGLPELFSEHRPRSADEALALGVGDRARAEALGVHSLEVISYNGDTGHPRSYVALLRLDAGWHRLASWRARELDG